MKDDLLHVDAMLTDLYQLTMAYAYWKSDKHEEEAVFDLFFRKCPFNGEFAIVAGIEQFLTFVENFGYNDEEIEVLKRLMPNADSGFWEWISKVDASQLRIMAMTEGSVVFARVPQIYVRGPLGVGQLLETTSLNLMNYPTLIATQAARLRMAAGENKTLIEMGLRRAQGPNGALSGALYSYIGGFDFTSNVKAFEVFGIPAKGTHAHSFVTAFTGLDEVADCQLKTRAIHYRQEMLRLFNLDGTNDGELAAFIAYALAYPDTFLALVDTYDTLKSGVPNFLVVSLALVEMGHKPFGIRLDSGDLAYLSKESRKMFWACYHHFIRSGIDLKKLMFPCNLAIAASNDINEKTLHALNAQGHEIDTFGIGTHNITCQAQPALGGVFKLVEINGKPRIKLSENREKVTIPGAKIAFRLYDDRNVPVVDVMCLENQDEDSLPKVGKPITCHHPYDPYKKMTVTPSRIEKLHMLVWDGKRLIPNWSPISAKIHCQTQLKNMRPDHLRHVNPTPYKVALSKELYDMMHDLWQKEVG